MWARWEFGFVGVEWSGVLGCYLGRLWGPAKVV